MTESENGTRWRLQRARRSLDEVIDNMDNPVEVTVTDALLEVRARVAALEARVSAIEDRQS